jgi:hypothetical protein
MRRKTSSALTAKPAPTTAPPKLSPATQRVSRSALKRPPCDAPPKASPAPVIAFGLYRPKIAHEVFGGLSEPKVEWNKLLFIAREPFRPGLKPIVITFEDDLQLFANGITRLDPGKCEFLGDATRIISAELLDASFRAASKTDKHILSAGADAYATLKYLCVGGELKGKKPEWDSIDVQILERWPDWQRQNLPMKERAKQVKDKKGITFSSGRLTTRCRRLGLIPNIRERRRRVPERSKR